MKNLILTFYLIIHLNFSFLNGCSENGFEYNNKCYCPNEWSGSLCQIENQIGVRNDNQECHDLINNLDHLFNISPDDYNSNQDDPQFPRLTGDSLGERFKSKSGQISWITMQSLGYNFKLFGNDIAPNDFKQGELNTCYLLSAFASMAVYNKGQLIKDMFMTKTDNPNNVYVTRWMIMGKPRMVAVDNYIPAHNPNGRGLQPIFTSFFGDEDFWALVIEKAWAKIHRQFSHVANGIHTDVWRAVTSAPTYEFEHRKKNEDEIFKEIKRFYDNQWPIGVSTFLNVKIDLRQRHGFAVLGVYEVNMDQQNLNLPKQKLIKVQDPYNDNYHMSHWNKWSNEQSVWTKYLRDQVDFPNQYGGIFIVDLENYKKQFGVTNWAEIHQGYKTIYKEILFHKIQKPEIFKIQFNLNKRGRGKNIFISIEKPMESLLYRSKSCKQPFEIIEFQAVDTLLNKGVNQTHEETSQTQTQKFSNSLTGLYTVNIKVQRKYKWLKNFVLTVYAPSKSVNWLLESQKYSCENGCNQNGKCDQETGICICKKMYSGEYCENIENKCTQNQDCANGGTCQLSGQCICIDNWTGHDCSKKI